MNSTTIVLEKNIRFWGIENKILTPLRYSKSEGEILFRIGSSVHM